jgi:hypothetical protein
VPFTTTLTPCIAAPPTAAIGLSLNQNCAAANRGRLEFLTANTGGRFAALGNVFEHPLKFGNISNNFFLFAKDRKVRGHLRFMKRISI